MEEDRGPRRRRRFFERTGEEEVAPCLERRRECERDLPRNTSEILNTLSYSQMVMVFKYFWRISTLREPRVERGWRSHGRGGSTHAFVVAGVSSGGWGDERERGLFLSPWVCKQRSQLDRVATSSENCSLDNMM